MDITDLPALFATFHNKEKLERINFIVEMKNQDLISTAQADIEIDKIIREEVKQQ